jgi:hypothetical protein
MAWSISMRSLDTAIRIVLRSENGWMADQIDPRAIEHLVLAEPTDRRVAPS